MSFPINRFALVSILLLTMASPWSQAKVIHEESTEQVTIQVETVAEGLGVPWGLEFLSPAEIIYTERSGNIGILNLTTGKIKRFKNVPKVMAEGQGGMLDVAVPPGYKQGDWIHFTYSKEVSGQGVTVLSRAKLKNGELSAWEEMLETVSASDTGRHFGSRITYDDKGHLFFSVGDRAVRPEAQNLNSHIGTVIRLNLDGSIPKDNPFVKNKQALDEIWSYGHRNPQGLVFDKANARLWSNEHGPRGGDEINLVEPGKNYGWPVISYGKEYWGPKAVGESTHKEGMEQPKKVYTPSIAPGSLMHYTGDVFKKWNGDLFSGALKLTHINRVGVNTKGKITSEERILEDFGERIRALKQGPDGLIYFSTDSGKILKLTPKK